MLTLRSKCILRARGSSGDFSNARHAIGPQVIRALKGDLGHTIVADLCSLFTQIGFVEPMCGFVKSTIFLGHSGRPSLQHLRSRLLKYEKRGA